MEVRYIIFTVAVSVLSGLSVVTNAMTSMSNLAATMTSGTSNHHTIVNTTNAAVITTSSTSNQGVVKSTPSSGSQLVSLDGKLVRLIDNCTVGDASTCHHGYCCTKKYMVYQAGFIGDKPVYQLECKPLRTTGEFCYFTTPEQFCPCVSHCHTNGFYGTCSAVTRTFTPGSPVAAVNTAVVTMPDTSSKGALKSTPSSGSQLVTIGGKLVRRIDDCTVGNASTCHYGYCCTKKYMVYNPGYIGDRPVYQLECKPLRKKGEYCYFSTPEQFCPCVSHCQTNGFTGTCI